MHTYDTINYIIVVIVPHSTNIKMSLISSLNRGSYMSAHALLNLLNELGKRDKM